MRNIINHQDLDAFLFKLKNKYPEQSWFIDHKIKSYIVKKEKTFIERDFFFGLSLAIKLILRKASEQEKKNLKE